MLPARHIVQPSDPMPGTLADEPCRCAPGLHSPRQLRLPFPHPVEDRKAIKDAIVEMTKKAKGAAAMNARTPGGTI